MSLIWGIPYLLIRVAVRDLSPADLVFARTAPAALLLLPVAYRRGDLHAVLPRWRWIATFAVVEMALPWLFLSTAEQRLPSSTAGLLIAGVPLLSALLYRVGPHHDPLTRSRLAGLVVGFAGVAALVGLEFAGSDARALAEMLVPAVGYSLGPLLVSVYLSDVPSLGVVSVAMTLTAVLYAPYALTHLPSHVSAEAGWSVAGLALICTALAFVLFFELIGEVGPARSTVITYLNPAVAVLLGLVVLGEPLSTGIAVGFPLILAGSVIATRGAAARQPEEVGPGPAP